MLNKLLTLVIALLTSTLLMAIPGVKKIDYIEPILPNGKLVCIEYDRDTSKLMNKSFILWEKNEIVNDEIKTSFSFELYEGSSDYTTISVSGIADFFTEDVYFSIENIVHKDQYGIETTYSIFMYLDEMYETSLTINGIPNGDPKLKRVAYTCR